MNREPWGKLIKMMTAGRGGMGARGNGRYGVRSDVVIFSPAACVTPGGLRRICGGFWTGGSRGDHASHRQEQAFVHHRHLEAMDVWTYRFYAAAPLSRPGRSPPNVRSPDGDSEAPPVPQKAGRKINRAIVTRTIRLIIDEGHQILSRQEALRLAESMDLDLVEVDGKQDPPVCKMMDFNKERFKERQREKEHKKKQSDRRRLDDVKEVRFSTRTEPNDLELKAQMAQRLLSKGHRVKLTVIPHGNDGLAPKGVDLINQMLELLQGAQKVETGPRIEKQRAWVLIRPIPSGYQGDPKKSKLKSSSGEEVQ